MWTKIVIISLFSNIPHNRSLNSVENEMKLALLVDFIFS